MLTLTLTSGVDLHVVDIVPVRYARLGARVHLVRVTVRVAVRVGVGVGVGFRLKVRR